MGKEGGSVPLRPDPDLLVVGDVRRGEGRSLLHHGGNRLRADRQERLALPAAETTHPSGLLLALGTGLLAQRVRGASGDLVGVRGSHFSNLSVYNH